MANEKITLKIARTEGKPCACGTCGDSFQNEALERALMRIVGVFKANYDSIASKVKIEYDSQKTNQQKIAERLEKLGYRVEN